MIWCDVVYGYMKLYFILINLIIVYLLGMRMCEWDDEVGGDE